MHSTPVISKVKSQGGGGGGRRGDLSEYLERVSCQVLKTLILFQTKNI